MRIHIGIGRSGGSLCSIPPCLGKIFVSQVDTGSFSGVNWEF
ncbi:hypothetical protein BACEGG_03592 [Bacteroides eggerthii DSM 20697]|nr:hypothetical protein BACEGG_03592 [Bacteroides eggerthii DSM 20697]